MSVLYLQFENGDRATRVQKLSRSGAHVVPVEPRWPMFFELAKKEKPYAIAIDFSQAPSHCLETADYLSKAKETRETPIYLLRVPGDRTEAVKKRLPNASIVTEHDLAGILVVEEKKAQERAREKKEAAAQARKNARAKKLGLDKPPTPAAAAGASPGKGKNAARVPMKLAVKPLVKPTVKGAVKPPFKPVVKPAARPAGKPAKTASKPSKPAPPSPAKKKASPAPAKKAGSGKARPPKKK